MGEAPPKHLSSFITKKLSTIVDSNDKDNLGALNDIRQLLQIPQEDRQISKEEIQELEQIERKMLQNRESLEVKSRILPKMRSCSELFLFISFIHSVVLVTLYIEKSEFMFRLLANGLIKMACFPIHLAFLYRTATTVKVSKSTQTGDDERLPDNMTTTMLTARQKAIVETLANEVEPVKERLRWLQRSWRLMKFEYHLVNLIHCAVGLYMYVYSIEPFTTIDGVCYGIMFVISLLFAILNRTGLVKQNI